MQPHSDEYLAYLESDAWALKRMAAIARAGSRCERCNLPWPLEVHHKTYDRLGDELPDDLEALCTKCHHQADKQRANAARNRQWWARLDGWATTRWGEDWESIVDADLAEEMFDAWLDRQAH